MRGVSARQGEVTPELNRVFSGASSTHFGEPANVMVNTASAAGPANGAVELGAVFHPPWGPGLSPDTCGSGAFGLHFGVL